MQIDVVKTGAQESIHMGFIIKIIETATWDLYIYIYIYIYIKHIMCSFNLISIS